jgi:riboflavin kinase/FMN adenylyltransferase
VVTGAVQKGRRLGRTLGFPTANLALPSGDSTPPGVYAVRVTLCDGRVLDGVANLGRRPTFGPSAPLLEVHVFDLRQDLYGQRIEVELVARLRSERRFESPAALAAQIRADAEAARTTLRRR